MDTVKQWDNGDLLTLSYSGEGNGSISVMSEPNEGIDRSMIVVISTTKGSPVASQDIIVNQEGLREVFHVSDGAFLLSDNSTYNVLKQ